MNLFYHILKLAQRFERGSKMNVNLLSLQSSIQEFLKPTQWDRYLSIFVHADRLLIMIAMRYYDIGKRIIIVLSGAKGKIPSFRMIKLELEKKGILSSIRINNKSNGKKNIYLRIEHDYTEDMIFKVIVTIILDVLRLDQNTSLDVVVKTSEVKVLKQLPSDPTYNDLL